MRYERYGDHRGRTGHALVFYFSANGSTNPDGFFTQAIHIFVRLVRPWQTIAL